MGFVNSINDNTYAVADLDMLVCQRGKIKKESYLDRYVHILIYIYLASIFWSFAARRLVLRGWRGMEFASSSSETLKGQQNMLASLAPRRLEPCLIPWI